MKATSARASVVGGIRFENNGSFGFYAAPRVAASWEIHHDDGTAGSTRVRASAGRGIKEPTFRQSYNPSTGDLGNPDLKPERSRGFDAGIEQRLSGERLRVETTYFANHFDDLISLGPSDPVTFASQYMNIGETRASGLEFSADAAAATSLRLHAAYTFLDSKVIHSTSSSKIFAPGSPPLPAAAPFGFRPRDVHARSHERHAGRRVRRIARRHRLQLSHRLVEQGLRHMERERRASIRAPHGGLRDHRQSRESRLHGAAGLSGASDEPFAWEFEPPFSQSPNRQSPNRQ